LLWCARADVDAKSTAMKTDQVFMAFPPDDAMTLARQRYTFEQPWRAHTFTARCFPRGFVFLSLVLRRVL
jgi:hypothetical protein